MEKIYCYVDESGQHTKGEYFLVSVLIADEDRATLEKTLLSIEAQSRKRHLKWSKTKNEYRIAYLKSVINSDLFKNRLYSAYYENSQDYVGLTISGTAKAIQAYIGEDTEYKATVLVDGLQRSEVKRFAVGLRKEGIRTQKVVGRDDTKDAFIRLADALCGLVSYAMQDRSEYRKLFEEAQRKGLLHLL